MNFTAIDLILFAAVGQLLALGIYALALAVAHVGKTLAELRRMQLEHRWKHGKG